MSKIICIVGITGTGKTALAAKLSQSIPSIIVSADSRQVYCGMNIVTGKDHPDNVTIYGLDLVQPDQLCSVSLWYDAVIPLIRSSLNEGKTPILVGGTGLYVQAITAGIDTINVPINPSLRDQLNKLTVPELQLKLSTIAPGKYNAMNHSDQNNPRRLIRAIEIFSTTIPQYNISSFPLNPTIVGLYYSDWDQYREVVRSRVISRLKLGAIAETKSLIQSSSLQSLSAIGYRSIKSYQDGKITEEQMIDAWVKDELSYAKRQLTYFRKLGVIWYDRTVATDEEIIYDILQS